VIKTDSTYYDGAGFTILGGINLFAPKIPVILPWPSKKRALFLLQKSYALNKENPLICRFLAEALYSEGKVDEAKAIATQALSSTQVSSDGFVEDTFTKRTIKKLLAAWK
jgi:tetratricopeptide (TPR) repeat protein